MQQRTDRPRGVLVVDDDAVVRTILGMLFRRQGLPVWLARKGSEAVEIFQHHGLEITLAVVEVAMPDVNGAQTLMQLRESDPTLACYFLCGGSHPYANEELMEMGAVGLAVKPLTEKMLAEIVDECLVYV